MNRENMLEYLAELGKELSTQDNLATADPIFVVMQKKKVVGVDSSYNSTYPVWVIDDEGIEADEEISAALEKCYGPSAELKHYSRVECMDIDEWVQPFFTRKAAEEFIFNNAKRLNKPFVYVETAYYNPQWKALRTLMMIVAHEQGKEGEDELATY